MLKASDIMNRDVITVRPETSVAEVAKLLRACNISGVPVLDGEAGSMVGIVSEGDLIGHANVRGETTRSWWLELLADPQVAAKDYVKSHGRTVGEVMTENVISVGPDTLVPEIARLLEQHKIKRVPVLENGRLVGIVTRSNLLQALVSGTPEQSPMDDQARREHILRALRGQPWANLVTINVTVTDGVAHVFGFVRSVAERKALTTAASAAPGIERVEDHTTIRSFDGGI